MRHTLARDLDAPASAVVATLHDLDHVADWIPGLLDPRVEPQPDGTTDLAFRLRGPRTLSLRLSIERVSDGLRYTLVEGDLSTVEGAVVVTAIAAGASVTWGQDLVFPVAVPRLLLRELDEHVFPAWIDRLGHAARTRGEDRR